MIIYLLRCVNGKGYVGQTIDSIEQRWKEHQRDAIDGKTLLYRAIRKYGRDQFERIVLEECTSTQQLDERERFWIAKLKTLNPNGYNMTLGGQGCHGFRHSNETKRHLSEVNKGKVFSEKTRQRMSKSATGRRLTDEAKRKCGEAAQGQNQGCCSDCSCGRHQSGLKRRLLT